MVTRIFAFGDQMTPVVFRVPFSKGDKDTEDVKKLGLMYELVVSFSNRTHAMSCMHLCLWKTLAQDCPHGKIRQFSTKSLV